MCPVDHHRRIAHHSTGRGIHPLPPLALDRGPRGWRLRRLGRAPVPAWEGRTIAQWASRGAPLRTGIRTSRSGATMSPESSTVTTMGSTSWLCTTSAAGGGSAPRAVSSVVPTAAATSAAATATRRPRRRPGGTAAGAEANCSVGASSTVDRRAVVRGQDYARRRGDPAGAQRLEQGQRVRIAVVRVLGQTAHHDPRRARDGIPSRERLSTGRGSRMCRPTISWESSPCEGRRPGQQVEQHGAHGVDVGAGIDLVAAERLLRAHIQRRADDVAGLGDVGRGLEVLHDPEIHQQRPAGAGLDHDVLRLEIAMHQPVLVGLLQGLEDRLDDSQSAAPRRAVPRSAAARRRSGPRGMAWRRRPDPRLRRRSGSGWCWDDGAGRWRGSPG